MHIILPHSLPTWSIPIKEVICIYTHPLKQGHHPRIVVESISRVNAYRKAKAYWLMMGYAVPNIIDVIFKAEQETLRAKEVAEYTERKKAESQQIQKAIEADNNKLSKLLEAIDELLSVINHPSKPVTQRLETTEEENQRCWQEDVH